MNKIAWIGATVLIYLNLATLLWKLDGIDGSIHTDKWYFIVSLPVFLFSAAFYILVKKMKEG